MSSWRTASFSSKMESRMDILSSLPRRRTNFMPYKLYIWWSEAGSHCLGGVLVCVRSRMGFYISFETPVCLHKARMLSGLFVIGFVFSQHWEQILGPCPYFHTKWNHTVHRTVNLEVGHLDCNSVLCLLNPWTWTKLWPFSFLISTQTTVSNLFSLLGQFKTAENVSHLLWAVTAIEM